MNSPKIFDAIQFNLSSEQVNKLNNWIVPVKQRASNVLAERRALAEQSNKPSVLTHTSEDVNASTTLGLKFSFMTLELGDAVEVTELITGESIDLTEYEKW